jgi:hypothetical protein
VRVPPPPLPRLPANHHEGGRRCRHDPIRRVTEAVPRRRPRVADWPLVLEGLRRRPRPHQGLLHRVRHQPRRGSGTCSGSRASAPRAPSFARRSRPEDTSPPRKLPASSSTSPIICAQEKPATNLQPERRRRTTGAPHCIPSRSTSKTDCPQPHPCAVAGSSAAATSTLAKLT